MCRSSYLWKCAVSGNTEIRKGAGDIESDGRQEVVHRNSKFKVKCVTSTMVKSIFCAFPQYDEYCAPILHVGGLPVDVVKTDSEGHARRYIEELDTLPETILCAGGDGTLAEVVTGKLCLPSLPSM